MDNANAYAWIKAVKETLNSANTSMYEIYCNELKQWILEYVNSSSVSVKTYDVGTVLYRGRKYEEKDCYDKWYEYNKYKELKFSGYGPDESFVAPKEKSNAGRCNEFGTQCLYVGENKSVCYVELRPQADVLISIAEIMVEHKLNVLDLSMNGTVGSSSYIVDLFLVINDELNRPINCDDDYIFTQFIAKCVKEEGFDGIRYTSAFSSITRKDAGKNIAIFNFDKCRAISSKLVQVENVEVHVKEK